MEGIRSGTSRVQFRNRPDQEDASHGWDEAGCGLVEDGSAGASFDSGTASTIVTTLRSVPSWGVSFLLHALLLLILAFIIQIRHAPAQPEARLRELDRRYRDSAR